MNAEIKTENNAYLHKKYIYIFFQHSQVNNAISH